MKRIVTLTETDLKRIVNRVISEDEQMLAGAGLKSCKELGIKQGQFIGEKEGNAYLMYHTGDDGKQVNQNTGGTPKRCLFKRYESITLR